MSSKTLAGIKKLQFILGLDLTLNPKMHLRPGKSTSVLGDWSDLALVDLASCNYTTERTDAGIVYTTKISGMLEDTQENDTELQHRLTSQFHAYQLTDIYGNKYLVGTNAKTFPEITFSPTNEANPSGLRAVPFEITWISTLPPIPIA